MIRRFCYSLFSFTLIFCTNSNAMKKGKPKSTPKSTPKELPKDMSLFVQSLTELAPTEQEYCSAPDQAELEPFYEKLHEGYYEILAYKNNYRKLARNNFEVLAAGHIYNEEDGTTTQLPYAPGYYALGVMALEDNNFDKAAKAFVHAIEASSNCRQQRKACLHSLFAFGLTEIELKKYAAACSNLTLLYAHLEPNEYEAWQPKIRTKLTEITNKIEVPWRKPLALLLNNDKKKRESALKVFKNCIADIPMEKLVDEAKDFHNTLLLIRTLADKNLSPDARLIMAVIHACQYNKQKCAFTMQPIQKPADEFEKALAYMNAEEVSSCTNAKFVRGETNYEYGHFLETKARIKDAATRIKIRELYKQATLNEHELGCGSYAHACLENEEEPLTDEQAIAHLNVMRDLSNIGYPDFQNTLTKIFYFGHTFGCGYTQKADIREAYQHANKKLASLDMLILKGMMLIQGIKKENPKGSSIWDLEPNIQKGELEIEKAICVDAELAYIRLDEFFQSNETPQEIKNFIYKFVEKKQAAKKANLPAIRCFGDMLLSVERVDEGLRLFESISTVHNDPQGYCELTQLYRCGIVVQQNLQQATDFCIKALTFFDKKTIGSEDALQTRTHLQELITTLNSAEHKNNEQTPKLLEELKTAMDLCGIKFVIVKKAKE